MKGRRVNVIVEPRSTFPSTRDLPYMPLFYFTKITRRWKSTFKGGFPLSRNLYVSMHVNFPRVKGSASTLKLSEVQLLRVHATFLGRAKRILDRTVLSSFTRAKRGENLLSQKKNRDLYIL